MFIIICINSVRESTVLRSALHYNTFDEVYTHEVTLLVCRSLSTLQMWLIYQEGI